ncbi:MAG TPA: TetR/AcrR family transcriptional regulator [Phototrophicaceae bacterium]|nr:TetR/AcrR family transcriptional regulator [Phototrophicaceae bacterium]
MSEPAEAAPGKGARRRAALVEAAASLILERGPAAVTHRLVAERAQSSLSATTYYFRDLAELVGAGAELISGLWAEQAEWVAERADARAEEGLVPPEEATELLCDALLPPAAGVRGHYEQLAGAGRSPEAAAAYRAGRERLDAAIARLLTAVGSPCPAELALAVVDGAAVAALSEGRDPRENARRLLAHVL